jgi:hypothetical protein
MYYYNVFNYPSYDKQSVFKFITGNKDYILTCHRAAYKLSPIPLCLFIMPIEQSSCASSGPVIKPMPEAGDAPRMAL